MTKLSEMRAAAEEPGWPIRGTIPPSDILKLIAIAEAAHKLLDANGTQQQAALRNALFALEAT